ncbi:MAG: DMT family transporter [Acidisphaera sp.]|nr:DMT family transporter [Acidisphaera sp.]
MGFAPVEATLEGGAGADTGAHGIAAVSATRRSGDLAVGLACLLATAICWGLNWPLIKYLLTQVPPFSMRGFAGLLGAAVAFGFACAGRERLRPPAGQWQPLIASALLNIAAFMGASTFGMMWLSASEAVIIAYTMPLWAVLFAWPILHERPRAARLLALALGLSGVAVLMGAQPMQASWSKLPGVAIAFTGAWMFGLGTVLAKRRPPSMPPFASVAWQLVLGSTPFALPALLEHPHWGALPGRAWAGLLYLGMVPMVFAYVTWFRALRLLPAATAAIGTLMVPIVGVFGSALLLGEPLGLRQLAALGLTVAGVGLAVRA